MAPVPLEDVLLAALAASGIDPARWARAFARLLPSLLAIPTLGLLAFPIALRLAFALMLAATVAPSLSPPPSSDPLLLVLVSEVARGIPVALSVAICLWGAAMAGNLIDELRGGLSGAAASSGAGGPFGVLLALAALIGFLQLGGPARLAEALADAPPLREQVLRSAALALARGIQFAVALAGPLLAVVPFLELVQALAARAAAPLRITALLEPAKALALIGAGALLLDRLATGVVLWLDSSLPRR